MHYNTQHYATLISSGIGPVVAAACIVEDGIQLDGIQDSKATTEAQREAVYAALTSCKGRELFSILMNSFSIISIVCLMRFLIITIAKAFIGLYVGWSIRKLIKSIYCK